MANEECMYFISNFYVFFILKGIGLPDGFCMKIVRRTNKGLN